MPSAGAAGKRDKRLRNGACLLGATSAVSVPAPSAETVLPGWHRYRHGQGGGDGAESTGALEIAFHGRADRDTNPGTACRALAEEIRFD